MALYSRAYSYQLLFLHMLHLTYSGQKTDDSKGYYNRQANHAFDVFGWSGQEPLAVLGKFGIRDKPANGKKKARSLDI
jgi:hypothetical protein